MFDEMMKDFKNFRLVPAVEKILEKQKYDGSWTSEIQPALAYFLGDDFLQKAQEIQVRITADAPDNVESILSTLLMIFVLDRFYGPYQEDWEPNVRKAKAYLKKFGSINIWWFENEMARAFD